MLVKYQVCGVTNNFICFVVFYVGILFQAPHHVHCVQVVMHVHSQHPATSTDVILVPTRRGNRRSVQGVRLDFTAHLSLLMWRLSVMMVHSLLAMPQAVHHVLLDIIVQIKPQTAGWCSNSQHLNL